MSINESKTTQNELYEKLRKIGLVHSDFAVADFDEFHKTPAGYIVENYILNQTHKLYTSKI